MLSVDAPRVTLPGTLAALAIAATAAANDHYEPGHVYLVRPDAYVALNTGAANADAIQAALERIGV